MLKPARTIRSACLALLCAAYACSLAVEAAAQSLEFASAHAVPHTQPTHDPVQLTAASSCRKKPARSPHRARGRSSAAQAGTNQPSAEPAEPEQSEVVEAPEQAGADGSEPEPDMADSPDVQQVEANVGPEPMPSDTGDAASFAAPDAAPVEHVLPSAHLEIGVGATQRAISFGALEGLRQLDSGFVPALRVALDARFGERFFIGPVLAYQSSVLAKISQNAPDPRTPALHSTIQTHQLSLGMLPGVHFGESRDSAAIGLFLGYGVRAFGSVVELTLPRFTWHGPLARLEFELPLAGGTLMFRLAPEAQAILAQTPVLRQIARTQGTGFAYGGEANMRVSVADWIAVAVGYRESHASIASGYTPQFEDVERFVFLEVFVRYY